MTPELIEDVRRLVPTVMYLETVAAYLGVTSQTIRNWCRRGRLEEKRLLMEGGEPAPAEAIYLDFFCTIKKALAEGEIHDCGVIKKAAQSATQPVSEKRTIKPDGTVIEEVRYAAPEWQAAAWRLERRFPERWGANRNEIRDLQKRVVQLEKEHVALPQPLPAIAQVPPPAGEDRAPGSQPEA